MSDTKMQILKRASGGQAPNSHGEDQAREADAVLYVAVRSSSTYMDLNNAHR